MRLFYSPGACSLSPHIALREAGLDFTLTKVDLKTKQMEDGGDFFAINPKGYVPALQLDDGSLLTEGPAIVQYIADRVPAASLAPLPGGIERYRLQEWLGYINSELHKAYGPLFKPDTPADYKEGVKAQLAKRFDYLSAQLQGGRWLMGEHFTVADGYLFTVLNWSKWVGIDLAPWPALVDFLARVAERPKVQAALKAEGLLA